MIYKNIIFVFKNCFSEGKKADYTLYYNKTGDINDRTLRLKYVSKFSCLCFWVICPIYLVLCRKHTGLWETMVYEIYLISPWFKLNNISAYIIRSGRYALWEERMVRNFNGVYYFLPMGFYKNCLTRKKIEGEGIYVIKYSVSLYAGAHMIFDVAPLSSSLSYVANFLHISGVFAQTVLVNAMSFPLFSTYSLHSILTCLLFNDLSSC